MRVGFDLDGVLYNFGDSVKRYLEATGRQHIWKSGPNKKPYWDFYKDWGWTGEEFVKMCNDGADAGYIFCGPARKGAPEMVRMVKDMGHTIVIITDRQFGSTPAVSHRNTRTWLNEHGIPFDELHFSADKTIVPTDIFIEDKLENYDHLITAGTPCVLVNRPWNETDGGDMRVRVDSAREYPAYVNMIDLAYKKGGTAATQNVVQLKYANV